MAGTVEEPLNRELYRIPGHAGWFSWNAIHTIEREALVEFFEGKTLSKTPKIYKDYRDFMINKYRENPRRLLTFTEVRKMLIGDVNCLRRVFEFLEKWGLINHGAVHPEAEAAPNSNNSSSTTLVMNAAPPGMQIVQKPYAALQAANLGSRENAFQPKGQQGGGGNKADEWSQHEIMLLLEGVSKYGDNWTKVQQHVGTKNKSQCVKQFIQLPFGDQFLSEEGEFPSKSLENGTASPHPQSHPGKKQKLSTHSESKDGKASKQPPSLHQSDAHLLEEIGISPLADSANPLLSQISFMSAMVGPRVAAAAAEAALAVMAEEEPAVSQLSFVTPAAPVSAKEQKEQQHKVELQQNVDSNSSEPEAGSTEAKQSEGQSEAAENKDQARMSAAQLRTGFATALAAAAVNAKRLADQEEREMEVLMANIIETQLKKLHSKLEHFEELEHLMEKERLQLEQMREQVFIDRIQLMRKAFPSGNAAAVASAVASAAATTQDK